MSSILQCLKGAYKYFLEVFKHTARSKLTDAGIAWMNQENTSKSNQTAPYVIIRNKAWLAVFPSFSAKYQSVFGSKIFNVLANISTSFPRSAPLSCIQLPSASWWLSSSGGTFCRLHFWRGSNGIKGETRKLGLPVRGILGKNWWTVSPSHSKSLPCVH